WGAGGVRGPDRPAGHRRGGAHPHGPLTARGSARAGRGRFVPYAQATINEKKTRLAAGAVRGSGGGGPATLLYQASVSTTATIQSTATPPHPRDRVARA